MKVRINKDFERRIAKEAARRIAVKLQVVVDGVHREQAGKPVEGVRPVLRAALRQAEFTPSDEQIDSWSQAISEGTHIVVRPGSA